MSIKQKILIFDFSEEAMQKGFSIVIDNRDQFWKETSNLFGALRV